MPAVNLSKQAKQDLLAIWTYIVAEDPKAADRVLDTLNERISLLVENPLLGPRRPHIAPELRYLVSRNYLILYRADAHHFEIVRVLHGARNLSALFNDDDTP